MINYMTGNIFDSECEWLVNPVNCKGAMGAGLARQFKHRFPQMYTEYQRECRLGTIKVGTCYRWAEGFFDGGKVLLFPTKDHWLEKSEVKHVDDGLQFLTNAILTGDFDYNPINSIAFPMLGCGLGGLEWRDVKPVMEKHLLTISDDIRVEIWEHRP